MIELQMTQKTMLSMLEQYTGCTVVPSNTTKQMPQYPYISYTLINVDTCKGTYSEHTATKEVEGKETTITLLSMPIKLIYSFTVQAQADIEAHIIALKIKDFFEEAKRQYLADHDVVVVDVGAITQRDNLLTIEYEYRKGLDVTLMLSNIIEKETETIEKATINDIEI